MLKGVINRTNENIEKEFDESKCYFFYPFITKTRVVNGKKYLIRSYFIGRAPAGNTKPRVIKIIYKADIASIIKQ